MLKVNPSNRPSCEKILQIVGNKSDEGKFVTVDESNNLLSTIR